MTKNELSIAAGLLGWFFCILAGYAMFGEGGGTVGIILGLIWAAYIYHEK